MSTTEVSPSIFDRMLGTSYTPGLSWGGGGGPKVPSADYRFYVCYKGMEANPNAWSCIQRGMGFFDLVHGSTTMEKYDRKDVRVCAYNPSIFDSVVLSAKVGGAVTITINPK